MSEPLVLVDSSVWIRFWRNGSANPLCESVVALLKQERVSTNWLIRIEVLSGTPTEEIYRARDADFAELRQIELMNAVYQSAAALRWQLMHRGITIPVMDTLIAASAICHGCELLHDDEHFRLIARHAPLRFHPASAARP